MATSKRLAFAAHCLSRAASGLAGTLKCPADSAKVGNLCMDLYEASVWQIAPSNTALVKKVLAGKATLADLTAGGATQLGCEFAPYSHTPFPPSFPSDGNWTPIHGSSPASPGVYAISIPGVQPSTCITWFQAVQACAVSGKRLARNEEWQRAAAGTPDPGDTPGPNDCNTNNPTQHDLPPPVPANTGSRTNCKSSWGVFDMVGNVDEWVADWSDLAVNCTDWTSQTGIAGGDRSCFGGPGTTANPGETDLRSSTPGALLRGGSFVRGTGAGVLAVASNVVPSGSDFEIGFRCVR